MEINAHNKGEKMLSETKSASGGKKRLIAGILSIIPGLGQLYRKRWGAGIFIFLLFFLSIWFLRMIWTGFNPWFIGILFAWFIIWVANIIDAYKGPFYLSSPCEDGCPAHVRVSEYVSLLANNNFDEAYKVISNVTPFVGTLSRICPAPCEAKCSRKGIESPIAIRQLKRAISEYATQKIIPNSNPLEADQNLKSKKIAVIGGGPAGLTCAYELRKKGYAVTIFEKEKEMGGMLRISIPEYRLPKDALSKETKTIEDSGITIKSGVEVGKDVSFDTLKKDFDAVFIATGTGSAQKLNIEGENSSGVYYGIDFLKATKPNNPSGFESFPNKRTLVIGGGNVAIDAARTAFRLNAKEVNLICLESRKEMPACPPEVEESLDEGIKIHNSWGPKKIIEKDGKVSGVEFKKCISVFDKKGNFKPVFDDKTTMTIDCDNIIIAIGQTREASFTNEIKIQIPNNRTKDISKVSSKTSVPNIFAGGDFVTGPRIAIDAIVMGKKGAKEIDIYLRGFKAKLEEMLSFVEPYTPANLPDAAWTQKNPVEKKRISLTLIKDRKNFKEVEQVSSQELAIAEAKRCLQCAYKCRWR
ncbi:MAG: FAD-dependent oxidoreductase [bacterium]|nr:FAD-dependent oxidoreductase [bacterium]